VRSRGAPLGLIACLCLGSPALAEVQIVVKYTAHEDRIEPQKKEVYSDRTYTFFVTKNHQVKIKYNSGIINTGGEFKSLGSGFAGHSATGMPVVGRARIDNNGIVYSTFFDSFKIIIRVTINGKDSCSANVEYSLLPNHEYFEARTEIGGFAVKDTGYTAQDVTCNVSEVSM
jgi:hypothetical protein